MQPGAATKPWNPRPAAGAWLLVGLAACASAPPSPPRLSEAQLASCRAVEAAYRAGAPEYPALRDELMRDAASSSWVVRMFLNDIILVRDAREIEDDRDMLAAAAKLMPLAEARARAELRTFGALAVPVMIDDLIRGPQSHQRELGIDLMPEVGQAAKAPLLQLLRTGEAHERRAAARALGRIGIDDEVFAALRELAADGDYRVRADALRSFQGGGARAQAFLCERMVADADPFVRRTAAQTLGYFPTTASALAIVDFIERCRRENDREGERIAQRALMRLSGIPRARQPRDWREFAPQLDARAAAAAQKPR